MTRRASRITRRSDMEFLQAALEILEPPPSPLGSTVAILICTFFAAALTWSWFGRIDIVATAQ